MSGRWRMTVQADGRILIDPPAEYPHPTTGASYTVSGSRLTTNALVDHPGCQTGGAGTYTWSVNGPSAQFEVIQESCPARSILFAEQAWRRVQ